MTKTFLLLTAITLTTTVGMGKELDSPTNSLRPGDRLTEQRIVFQDLGRSGENVLWNLGEVEVEDGRYKLRYSAVRDSLHEWIAGTEHRTMYYYDQSAGDGIRIAGLENHTTFIHYDEQEMWLPLPLQYGDSVSGIFSGRGSNSGKELDRMHGLDWYDYGARHYDAALLRWHTMDPLCEKYYHISPYAFCANNFANAVDKDGREVHPSDSTAYHALLSTIAPEDKQYVILNAKGNIDYTTMKSHYSESKNYNSLIELAADELLFNIYIQTTYSYKDNEGALRNGSLTYFEADEYFADRDFSSPAGLTTGETGRYGISLLPGQGISKVNSTTKDVHIYIHPSLSPIGKAEALSHELYGHGYLGFTK